MTWEFFFRHFTPSEARSAGLTETEIPVLEEIAVHCTEALRRLDDDLDTTRPGTLPGERPAVLDAQIAQLRSRLGEAAFLSLDAYLEKSYEEVEDAVDGGPGTSDGQKVRQSIRFASLRPAYYGDPNSTLLASATSRLRVYFAASGDCTVRGATVHILSAGNCWITAHQPGNERFRAAQEITRLLGIGKASQWISEPEIGPRTYREPDISLNSTASSGLSIVFQTIGNCSVSRSLLHLRGSGTCTLIAEQTGNQDFNPALPVSQVIEVIQDDPSG